MILILSLLPLAYANGAAEIGGATASPNPHLTGSPFLRTWSAEDYGASPENSCVIQHPGTGLIYAGNRSGVLEFDGAYWRLIPAPGGAVGCLEIDGLGRIWGATGTAIFRLEADDRGEWRARSMMDRLPPEFRLHGPPARCVATPEGICFLDRKSLMRFGPDDGVARVWPMAEGLVVAIRLWELGDEPYVMIGGNRVFRVRDHQVEPVPGATNTICASVRQPDGSWRVLTPYHTLRWDGRQETVLGRLPKNEGAYAATILPDGRGVFATGRSGLIVCDPAGRILQTIGRAQGLPANQVIAVTPDREGGVWAAFNNGLARVQLDSPYALHGPAQGLEGTVNSLVRRGDRLYAAGTEGVTVRDPAGRFRPVKDVSTAVRELVVHDDHVFVLSSRLRVLRPGVDDVTVELENRNYHGLIPSTAHPGWMVHGANEGVRWARFEEGKWITRGPLAAQRAQAKILLEAPTGRFWAADAAGAVQVDFSDGLRSDARARRFRAPEGMPGTPTAMLLLGGKITALAGGRLLRFEETAGRFVPDDRITGLEALRGPGREPPPLAGLHLADDGTVWLRADPPSGAIARLVRDGADRWRAELLPGEPLRRLRPTTLFHDTPTQTLWIAGNGALVSRDLTWRPTRPPSPPVAAIRGIGTTDGERWRGGAAGTLAPLALEPDQIGLTIEFAAPAFQTDRSGAFTTEYRTRVLGLDRDWTPWSRQTERLLTNLPWRKFTFQVEARDEAHRTGPAAVLAFSIRPAWWATPWAWTGYGTAALLAVAGVVRLRTQTLSRRAARLELTVAERTGELARSNSRLAFQNVELARLNRLELDGKIAAQLAEEKARLEVLRYQLNPHFLYNSLNSIYGLLFENARDAGEMVLRLSDFCRTALSGVPDEFPTLDDELRSLRIYLDVEQVRWGEKLQIEFSPDPAVTKIRIPPFLLLPLVENAIKYGSRTTADGVLRLAIRAFPAPPARAPETADQPRALVIEIANTGRWVAPDRSRPDSTGIGLENLRQRLQRYYPAAHEFTVAAEGRWVVARVRLDHPGAAIPPPAPIAPGTPAP